MDHVRDFNNTVESILVKPALAFSDSIIQDTNTIIYDNNFNSKMRAVGSLALDSAMIFGLPELGAGKALASSLSKFGFWGKVGAESLSQSVTKHPLEGLSVGNVVRLTDEIGLVTPRDQLILWSGLGRDNIGVELSQEFARANGGITLEMTKGGSWLNKIDLFGSNHHLQKIKHCKFGIIHQ